MKKTVTCFIISFLIGYILCLLFEVVSNFYPPAGFSITYVLNLWTRYPGMHLLWLGCSLLIASVVTLSLDFHYNWRNKGEWKTLTLISKDKSVSHAISPRGSGSIMFFYSFVMKDDDGREYKLSCGVEEYTFIHVGDRVKVLLRSNRIHHFEPCND